MRKARQTSVDLGHNQSGNLYSMSKESLNDTYFKSRHQSPHHRAKELQVLKAGPVSAESTGYGKPEDTASKQKPTDQQAQYNSLNLGHQVRS